MNSDKVSEFVNSSDMEEAVVAKAKEVYPEAWDLALATEDEELFERVWSESLRLVIDDILTSLVEKGLMEVAGMTEDGQMSYTLTQDGRDCVADDRP